MTELSDVMFQIRKKQRVKERPANELSGFWTSEDLLDGKPTKCFTMIFQTRGCYWGQRGGCTMCGYVYDSAIEPPTDENILAQYRSVENRIEGGIVKIFTSGSFFDAREISETVRDEILSSLGKRASKVIVETRPEFVTDKTMEAARSFIDKFEVAIGLETSNDTIREKCINKHFTFNDFVRASEVAKAHGVTTKAYLLLKPPFLTEKDAMEDIVKSVLDVAPYAGTISINICNVQRGTLVDELFMKHAYRPPWLWSIVEVLKRVHGKTGSAIMSDPLAAGAARGPHNCGICDGDFADALRKYSLTQDISAFNNLKCDCRVLWEKTLELEDWTFGAPLIY